MANPPIKMVDMIMDKEGGRGRCQNSNYNTSEKDANTFDSTFQSNSCIFRLGMMWFAAEVQKSIAIFTYKQ